MEAQIVITAKIGNGDYHSIISELESIIKEKNLFNSFSIYEKVYDAKSDIEEVYKAYPTRCVVRGSSNGKSAKDKEKIKRLLKEHTKEELIKTIRQYTKECEQGNVYMKNFSTFLNNLPDYEEEKDLKSLIIWELDGKRQKSSLKDYEDNLQSKGVERVKFIEYAS